MRFLVSRQSRHPITLHTADKKTTAEYRKKRASWNYKRANRPQYELHAEDLCNVTVTGDMNQNVKQLIEAICVVLWAE